MSKQPRLVVGLIGCFLVAHSRVSADDAPKPDFKPFVAEVRKLVEKYYPKAKVTLKDETIYFEFNTRKYMIHEPLLSGEWQDAFEMVGPQKSGICGNIDVRTGKYGGQACLPQAFDKHYFTDLRLAPYSKKLDCHLLASLMYPSDASKEFVKEFWGLMDEFEKYVAARGK